jgi:hypothetical protein
MSYFKIEEFPACQCIKDSNNKQEYGPEFYSGLIISCTSDSSGYSFASEKQKYLKLLKQNINQLNLISPKPQKEIRHVEKLYNNLSDLTEQIVENYCKRNHVNEMKI